tara:strand:- start:3504 stop:4037 length:534 start_codon:yes stop_codon:yes gene_type:complete
MQKVRNHIPVILLALLGVTLLVITVVLYVWLYIRVDTTAAQIEQIQKETQLVAVQNDQMQVIRKILRDSSVDRAALQDLFVGENNIVSFLESAESLESVTGATITIQSVDSEDSTEFAKPLRMTIRAEGTLQSAYHTLALLEAFPQALYITTARLSRPPLEEDWVGEFSIEVIEILQ